MKPTKLGWEDVIQFEEVKGYCQHIWRDGNKLYYVTEEGGIKAMVMKKRNGLPKFINVGLMKMRQQLKKGVTK